MVLGLLFLGLCGVCAEDWRLRVMEFSDPKPLNPQP